MATVKKGLLTATKEYAKHLRRIKRLFWKAERKAARADARRTSAMDGRDALRFAPLPGHDEF